MAANTQPGRTNWADDGEPEPDLATAIPPPQITRNKDGSETVVTVFINEDGKKVKRTQRIRRTTVKKRENPRVAERRLWAKIGPEAGKPAGPRPDTTTLGENIIFRPKVGFKSGQQEEKAPEEDKKADQLKKMQIKCRICSGDHFTTKCPFKDTMAPEGEAAGAPADVDNGMDDAGGLGIGGSSYVPPHMRKGAAGATGERMGGKFERDDLATLRVTNVRFALIGQTSHVFPLMRVTGLGNGRRARPPRDLRASRPCYACVPCKRQRDRPREGFRFRVICRPFGCGSGVRKSGRLRVWSFDSQGGVCEEGYLGKHSYGIEGVVASLSNGRRMHRRCWCGSLRSCKITLAQHIVSLSRPVLSVLRKPFINEKTVYLN